MTKIEKLVAVLAGPAQDLENAFQQLLLERAIDTAVGVQLDLLGKLVGQVRNGLADDDYRRYISARIATNNSNGLFEDLIKITVLIVNDLSLVVNAQGYPIASVVVYMSGISMTTDLATIVYSFLFQAKKAGVKLYVVYSIVAPAITFTYDGTSAQAYDAGAYAGVLG